MCSQLKVQEIRIQLYQGNVVQYGITNWRQQKDQQELGLP